MPEKKDWRRRFTEQEIEDDTPARPRRQPAPPPPARDEGDPEQIRVIVDDQARVTDVLIPANWQSTVSARDLPNVLREKANEAILGRIKEQVDGLDIDAAQPVVTHREAPSANGDPDSPVAQNLLAEVMDLFARVDAELTTYASQVRQAAKLNFQGRGMNSRISVTSAQGQITGLTIDQHWLANARHTEIRAEALSAFQDAARHATTAGATAIQVPPALARLQELASDPVALSRQLGALR